MFEGEFWGVKGYFKVNGGWNILSFIATNEVNFSLQKKIIKKIRTKNE